MNGVFRDLHSKAALTSVRMGDDPLGTGDRPLPWLARDTAGRRRSEDGSRVAGSSLPERRFGPITAMECPGSMRLRVLGIPALWPHRERFSQPPPQAIVTTRRYSSN